MDGVPPSDIREMAKKALDKLNNGQAGDPNDIQEMAKKALSNMDKPNDVKESGVEGKDIKELASMALGNMNGVSSKFIPAIPEEDNSLETLTNRALNAMPTSS